MDSHLTSALYVRGFYLNSDKKISFSVVFFYIIEALNMSLKTIFPISDLMWQSMSRSFMFVLIAVMLWSLKPVLQRSVKAFAIAEFIFVALFSISFFFGNAEQKLLLSKAFSTLCICIPLAAYVYSIKDKNIFYHALLKCSYLLIPLLTIVYFKHINIDAVYNMSVSYAIALPTMIQINEAIKHKKAPNIIFGCTGIIVVILYGARGPLLCLFTMLAIKIWRHSNTTLKRTSLILLSLTALSLFAVYYKQILNVINIFLFEYGVYSRTLYLLKNNQLLQGSGRDVLFNYYWDLVLEKPIFGWGFVGGWINDGLSPHNMLIELLLAFGIISGSLLSITIIIIVARSLFKKEGKVGELLLIYASLNIVMFFVSGDFLENPKMFILVALYFSKNESQKNKIVHGGKNG